MIKLKIKKLQCDINREAAKILVSSSRQVDKYEYLQVEKYYHLIQVEQQNKLRLRILLQEKLFKNE